MNTFKAVAIGLGVAAITAGGFVVLNNNNRVHTETYRKTVRKDLLGLSRELEFTTVSDRTYFGKNTNTYVATLAVNGQEFVLSIRNANKQPCELAADVVQQILREFNVDKHYYALRYTNNQYIIAAK